MDDAMRALSVQQPWCSAIACGPKRVENRSWPAPRWIIGQRIAVHASKGPDWHAPREAWTAAGIAPYVPGSPRAAWTGSLPLGAIIATATVAGCHDWHECMQWRACSDWAVSGQQQWVLADVHPLLERVPCNGKLGLWPLPDEVESAVLAQLEETATSVQEARR